MRYALTVQETLSEGEIVEVSGHRWVVVAQVGAAWDGVRRTYEVEAALDAEGVPVSIRFGYTLSGPLP